MVYKLISEWFSEDRSVHQIDVFKMNYNHEELVRYIKSGLELKILTFVINQAQYEETYDIRNGSKKWWNYNTMKVNRK